MGLTEMRFGNGLKGPIGIIKGWSWSVYEQNENKQTESNACGNSTSFSLGFVMVAYLLAPWGELGASATPRVRRLIHSLIPNFRLYLYLRKTSYARFA